MDGHCSAAVRLVTPGFSGRFLSPPRTWRVFSGWFARHGLLRLPHLRFSLRVPRAHQRPTTCGHAQVWHLAAYLHRRPEVPRESPSHPLAFWLTLLVDRPSTFVQFKSTASRAPATAVLIPPVPTHVICVALSSDCSVLATSACHPQTAMFGRVRRTRPASPVRVALGHYYLYDINAA